MNDRAVASLCVFALFMSILALAVSLFRSEARHRAMVECLRLGSTASECERVVDP